MDNEIGHVDSMASRVNASMASMTSMTSSQLPDGNDQERSRLTSCSAALNLQTSIMCHELERRLSIVLGNHHAAMKEEFQRWSHESRRQDDMQSKPYEIRLRTMPSKDSNWSFHRARNLDGAISPDLAEGATEAATEPQLKPAVSFDKERLMTQRSNSGLPPGETLTNRRVSVTDRIERFQGMTSDSLFLSKNFGTRQSQNAIDLIDTISHGTLRFEGLCALIIFGNSICIAIQTEMEASGDGSGSWEAVNEVFNGWFLLEIMIRVYRDGVKNFFCLPEERNWNFFDMMLICLWVVDKCVAQYPYAEVRGILRILRLLRVLRTLRIFRFVREVREFRKMIFAIGSTLNTLFWALLLLVFEMFFFSILFLQAMNNTRDEFPNRDTSRVEKHWGRMALAFYSLFKSIANGVSWGEVMDPLFELQPSWLYPSFFLFYVSVTLLGIMNVLTAVFVESAMTSTHRNRDLLIDEKEGSTRMYVRHIMEIFKKIDADGSGSVELEEIEKIFKDPSMSRLLEALEIEAYDAFSMFKLLDCDDSGSIDLDEFCDGCLRLRGEAKSFDIQCLMFEHHRLAMQYEKSVQCNEESFGELRQIIRDQSRHNDSKIGSLVKDLSSISKAVSGLNRTVSDLRNVFLKQVRSVNKTGKSPGLSPISFGECSTPSEVSVVDLNSISFHEAHGAQPSLQPSLKMATEDPSSIPLLQEQLTLPLEPAQFGEVSFKACLRPDFGPLCRPPTKLTAGIRSV